MAFHHACYEQKFGKTAKKATAKYKSACEVCGNDINPGDAFTWTRRVGQGGGIPAPAPAQDGIPVSQVQGNGANGMQALAAMLVPALKAMGIGGLSEQDKEQLLSTIVDAADAAIAKAVESIPKPTTVEIVVPGIPMPIDMGTVHKTFPTLLKACMAAKATGAFGVWMAGPSGSGKTTAAQQAAKALSLTFYYTGAVGDQYALIGYNDAQGRYIRTAFRDAYENGGVFLWDEVDASDPSALLAFNAALANGHAAFPDGIITRHPDFIPIAAANTYGHGGTHEYVGRNKLDMAFLKRFAAIHWDYDWDMVKATCPNLDWVLRVEEVCNNVRKKGIRVIVTPRECYIGAALLAAGLEQDQVEDMTIRSGMTEDQWKSVS